MKSNPQATIEIGVHSDSRTNPNCCDNPTERRAKSIANYFVTAKISSNRIKPKGYGESKLFIKDAQFELVKTKAEKEALHALNRRVVFKIIALQ